MQTKKKLTLSVEQLKKLTGPQTTQVVGGSCGKATDFAFSDYGCANV